MGWWMEGGGDEGGVGRGRVTKTKRWEGTSYGAWKEVGGQGAGAVGPVFCDWGGVVGGGGGGAGKGGSDDAGGV